jgi:hypothetical protein
MNKSDASNSFNAKKSWENILDCESHKNLIISMTKTIIQILRADKLQLNKL